ncbi:ornithine carbamoyltransferase [candidate division KSB1 bacterium]|nr:ornithine carbamoyltransferase [candidate division KSB1 bacterium]
MSATGLRGKHLITWEDWSKNEIEKVLAIARDLKTKFVTSEPHRLLQDKTLFMIFAEKSIHTRNAIAAGISQLGGHAFELASEKIPFSVDSNVKDTAVVISRMGHGVACRNPRFGNGNKFLNELAKWASVPVLSLEDDIYHPIQALADLMTMQEYFGNNLRGFKVALSWAYADSLLNPLSLPQSLLLLLTRFGIDVSLAMPEEFPLMEKIVHRARNNAQLNDSKLNVTDNMEEAFHFAHIVIPVNWGGYAWFEEYVDDNEHRARMKENLDKYRDWICNQQKMNLADPHVKYMHPLPVDRGKGTEEAVADGPVSLIYEQAENQLHISKAIMALTLGGK